MAAVVAICIGKFAAPPAPKSPHAKTYVVKVSLEDSHGAGVHIGSGRFLTAAHVVKDADTVTLMDSQGVPLEARVLWRDIRFDVALLASDKLLGRDMQSAKLACRPLVTGEGVRMDGYPFALGLVTTFGRIASATSRKMPHDTDLLNQDNYWSDVALVDGTLAPGMSGGPVTATDGSLIGINIGAIPGFPINSIVPSSAICALLARD